MMGQQSHLVNVLMCRVKGMQTEIHVCSLQLWYHQKWFLASTELATFAKPLLGLTHNDYPSGHMMETKQHGDALLNFLDSIIVRNLAHHLTHPGPVAFTEQSRLVNKRPCNYSQSYQCYVTCALVSKQQVVTGMWHCSDAILQLPKPSSC